MTAMVPPAFATRPTASLCVLAALCLGAFSLGADNFGNGTVIQPTTASGGTGTVANLQSDNDVKYTVAKSATMTVGGFAAGTGTINSVYVFAQYSIESSGYSGTNALQVNGVNTTIVPALRDYGRWEYTEITAGSFGVDTWAEIASLSITFTNNDGGGGDSVLFDCIYIVVNPTSPIPIHPTWIEDFNGTGAANPAVWNYEVGYQRNNEDQYYQSGTSNGWQEGGNFVIEGRKESVGGYAYTSASIVTNNKYYWHYGRAQIRAQIPAKTGMWPAIWGTGEVGDWPHNGEVDIMEYYGSKILANCAVGTANHWEAKWDGSNRTMSSLTSVDPNWKTQWHIWTMQWDDQNVRLYVDNILMNTIPQTWLRNASGTVSWGPEYPFKDNGMSCWLNLAIGGNAGGDPIATMNSGPQRYLIDYWKVWEGATDNVAPTDIVMDSYDVQEGQPAGTIVCYLSAVDADPAEVHKYQLVAGAGDTDNALFSIPEFVSDNTLLGALKTTAMLDYADGPTRSIRVKVTDIEGATYTKVLTINVLGQPEIEVSPGSVSVPEGGTQTFDVRLKTFPASNITVAVSRQSGDSNITVSSGSSLVFTPTNATTWKTVTLAAAQDADRTNGVAIIQCVDGSGAFTSATVTATEADDDNVAPVVDAGIDNTIFLTGSTPWTPAELSLAAWYDASDATTITAASGVVSQWRDKSVNGNHLAATGDPMTGTRTINSLNAIDFSSDYFTMGSDINLLGKSAFVVILTDTLPDNSMLFGRSTENVQLRINTSNQLQYAAATSYYTGTLNTTSAITLGVPSVVGYLLNSTMQFSLDGTFEDSGATSGSGMTTYNWVGRRNGATANYIDGAMGEIVITGGMPTTIERQRIEGYLAHKWGKAGALPGAHPFKSTPPGVAAVAYNLDGTVSDPEGDSLTALWSLVSGPAPVSFGDAGAVDTTASFTVEGAYVLRLTADDGVDITTDEVTIVVSAPNVFSTWAGGTFAHPFTQIGYNSNPDGDALTNLQEFAFGTDPTSSVHSELSYVADGDVTGNGVPIMSNFAAAGEAPAYRAVFLRRKDHSTAGLTYRVDFTAELQQWSASAATPTVLTGVGSAGDYEAVSVPFPATVPAYGGSQNLAPKFFHVDVIID